MWNCVSVAGKWTYYLENPELKMRHTFQSGVMEEDILIFLLRFPLNFIFPLASALLWKLPFFLKTKADINIVTCKWLPLDSMIISTYIYGISFYF